MTSSKSQRVAGLLPPALLILWVGILLVCLLAAGCGDDEKPTPPPPKPDLSLDAINGTQYKSLMGSATTDPALSIQVIDTAGAPVQDEEVRFAVLTGDGTLSDTSMITDAFGLVSPAYTFDGALGHALVRAWLPDMDTIELTLRANTPIPGPDGQAQYVLFSETYADVLAWNGSPDFAVLRSCAPNDLIDIVYESSEGVVFVIADINANGVASVSDPVVGCFFTTYYAPTTADGLGIGSNFSSVPGVYGEPIDTLLDASAPPVAWVYRYDTPYMNWWVDTLSDTVFQIDFFEAVPCPTASSAVPTSLPMRVLRGTQQ